MSSPTTLHSGTDSAFAGALRLGWQALCLVAADFLLAGSVLTLGGAFWLDRFFAVKALALMSAIVVAGHVLSLTYWPRRSARRVLLFGQLVAGNLLAAGIYWAVRGHFGGLVSRPTFLTFLAIFFPIQAALHLWYRRDRKIDRGLATEPLRVAVLLAALLALHRPLLSRGSVGAGDAYWYSIMVADFVSQWRAGIFPVFVGQSEFAFNGAISPLRLAPALQHFAGVVDLVTLRSLPFHGILNLTLLACYLGGGGMCYRCLRAIEPGAAWLALGLSLLFSACPGVLALAYAGDLFMSVTTLPFVPLLLYGAWRTLVRDDRTGTLIMSAAAAALWYCHPPIALWGTIVAAATQLVRLGFSRNRRALWPQWALGAGVFAALSLYCFTSVKLLGIPAYPVFRPVLIENVQNAYPDALFPVSSALAALSDYQLGWSLWGVLLAGLTAWLFVRPRLAGTGLLAAILILLLLLAPTPWLLNRLWLALPQAVCDITFMWPMQRFYVLLAGLSVFLAFSTLGPAGVRRPWLAVGLLALLLVGANWSRKESLKFQKHAIAAAVPAARARQQHLPQNHILTRYSFNPFREIPPYFSHGFIDPQIPNRLLAPGTFEELASNAADVEGGKAGPLVSEGVLAAFHPDPAAPTLGIRPDFRLEPGQRYILRIDFDHPDFVGGLALQGERMARVYWLPNSGYDTKTTHPSRAFGTLPGQRRSLIVWTDGTVPETISLQFFFTAEAPAGEVPTFGRYSFRQLDPSLLPIRVTNWIPYQATVTAPGPAFLETPRLFTDGYRARVNGREVAVAKSPDALVMLPVPAGNSRVELSFRGPFLLRFAYYVSLTAWILALAIGGRLAARENFAAERG